MNESLGLQSHREGVVRLWRRSPWNRNPLMRNGDRFSSAMQLLGTATMITAIPVCAALGTVSYTSAADAIHAERESSHTVSATIVNVGTERRADITWQTNGVSLESTQIVAQSARKGDLVTIWVDGAGERVDPPRSSSSAAAIGILTAVASYGLLALTVVVGLRLTSLGVLLRHGRKWSREWAELDAAHVKRRD